MDTEPIPLSNYALLKSLTSVDVNDIAYKNGFINLKNVEPSLGLPSGTTTTNSLSSYYFSIAATDKDVGKSRNFTGNNSLFLSGKNLSYNNNKPTFNFDISGNFRALSAYIPVLSTSGFYGNSVNFNTFSSIQINADLSANNAYLNYLSANSIFINNLISLSSRFDYYNVPSSSANQVFSSITWNVTAGDSLSAKNIKVLSSVYTPYLSTNSSFFNLLTADNFLIKNDLNYTNNNVLSVSASHLYGYLDIDQNAGLNYQDKLLSVSLSGSYFFGVKPSDSYSTDNINITRSLNGSWDNDHNERLPVLKPYFKNIKQLLDYVYVKSLYGENLNILIYDDIQQDNVNNNGTFSGTGCSVDGNLISRYYPTSALPASLTAANIFGGDFIWAANNNSNITGSTSYWNTSYINFSNINFVGMYEIGSLINLDFKKEYTYKKPFNYSPRKLIFRTHISTNKNLSVGNFGQPSDWNNIYLNTGVFNRPIAFTSIGSDINLQNLCFEFDTNANDSTALWINSGNAYLSNITVATLGYANYAYGAVMAWPRSDVYICGVPQIDPYLLTSTTWNSWSALEDATGPDYYPGYGLAIVGNQSFRNIPSWLPNQFLYAYRGNMTIMDFNVNREIGRYSYLNSSIILDGNFSSTAFYRMTDHGKIFSNNYIFRTNNFVLSSLTWGTNNGIRYFNNTNDNFYYVYFNEPFNNFIPHYFPMISWEFDKTKTLRNYDFDNNQFTVYANNNNLNYKFDTVTKTVDLSGLIFGPINKNVLQPSILNDSTKLYNYVGPYDLPLYNTFDFYQLKSPLNNSTYSTYTLNYYASAEPTIFSANIYTTPTPTPTNTLTPTPTNTVTPSITPTNTVTPTLTPTPTKTVTPTVSPTQTVTPTISITPSNQPSSTPTPTPTLTPTVTPTYTPIESPTPTITPTVSITPIESPTPTPTPTQTPPQQATAIFAIPFAQAGTSQNFTIPSNASSVRITIVGGGGGAGSRGGGGGGGGLIAYNSYNVGLVSTLAGKTLTITIGSGGSAGVDGGDTIVTWDGNTITAYGGKAGKNQAAGGLGGIGGSTISSGTFTGSFVQYNGNDGNNQFTGNYATQGTSYIPLGYFRALYSAGGNGYTGNNPNNIPRANSGSGGCVNLSESMSSMQGADGVVIVSYFATAPSTSTRFTGWQNSNTNYRYLIQCDWDNCEMSGNYMLSQDAIVADGVEYSTDPAFNRIDGIAVWSALGDGNAICVYASGNYARVTNFSNYNYLGKISSIASLQSIYNTYTKQNNIVVNGCVTPSDVFCCRNATQTSPAAILCDTYSPPTTLDISLRAFYNFDNSINDSTRNGINLTSAGFTYDTGKLGINSVKFNGGGSYSGDGLIYNTDLWDATGHTISSTISMWYKNNSAYPIGTNVAPVFFGGWVGAGTKMLVRLAYNYNNGKIQAFYTDVESETVDTFTSGVWYHIVSVYNASNRTVTLYINGTSVLLNLLAGAGSTVPNFYWPQFYDSPPNFVYTGGFGVGCSNTGNSQAEWGDACNIDSLGIWDKALTANEVAYIYHQGKGRQYPFFN